ncbi:MAG: UbiA prenyltransferase family protein [Candidatus Diapherotrites archaeon]|nr:UbiA prenyltransferase family protein [Candidatus Diapherotrites archaeon]
MNPYVEIARPWQWYKNLVAFLGVFFAGMLLNVHALLSVVLTFFALCLASSGVYVLNDIVDVEKDRLHPIKRNRPLPSGRVSVLSASVYAVLLLSLSFLLAYSVNLLVFLTVAALVVNTLLYSFIFKRIAVLDVAVLALNFLFRTLAGVFAIGVYPSYWIIIIPYFIAVFLALLKRYGELQRTKGARSSLHNYDQDTLRILSAVTLGIILVLYTLYIFDSKLPHKTITAATTLPLAVFTLFRWYNDAMRDPDLAEDAAKMVYDKWFLIGGAVWALVLFGMIYIL